MDDDNDKQRIHDRLAQVNADIAVAEAHDVWAAAKAKARPDCPQCQGTGTYMYDHHHGKICELCCRHDMGWWLLEEHYRDNNGKWCCRAGCGFIRDANPDDPQSSAGGGSGQHAAR